MERDHFSLLLYRTCLVGSSLGMIATLYFLCGSAGYIGNPLLNIVTAAAVASAALFFLYVFFASVPGKGDSPFSLEGLSPTVGLLIWLLILAVLLTEVVLGLLPPTARDELTHHLAIPRLYIQAGQIIEVPFANHSYYPMLIDMLYTPFVKWGWDFVPKLVHGLFGFLTGILLFTYLAWRLNVVYGLLGFFFFVSVPIVLRLGNLAYVDLGLVFYSTASLLCILQWAEEGKIHDRSTERSRRNPKSAIRNPQSPWLVLAGLSAGFAMAAKPNGLVVFVLLFLLLALSLGKNASAKETLACLLVFSLLAILPFGPWLLKNLFQAGNPFFPFFSAYLGDGERQTSGLGIFLTRRLLYGESWWEIAALPIRVFFSGQDDNPQRFDGVLTPLLVLFLPWAFKGKWVEEKKLLFGFALLYFAYAIFLVDLRIRYILPVVPPLVILLVYGIHNTYLRIDRPAVLYGAIVLLVGINGVYLGHYIHGVSATRYLQGKEDRESYLSRMLPDYPALQYINRNLPSEAKIYLLFTGNRGYYCERAYFYDTAETGRTLLRILKSAGDASEIRKRMSEIGVSHLLIRQDLLVRFLNGNLPPPQLEQWVGFGNRHLKLLFEKRGYAVYELIRESNGNV